MLQNISGWLREKAFAAVCTSQWLFNNGSYSECKLELPTWMSLYMQQVMQQVFKSKVCETKSLTPASNRMTETDTMILQM